MILSDRRYSQHARRSLVRARLLAQEYAHPTVDTDHLLIGIWRTQHSIGCQVLSSFQLDPEYAERLVQNLHAPVDDDTPPPFSPNLQAVLTYAADESYWLGQHYIGTEHILLGLVRSGTGQLSTLLADLRVSSHQMRQRLRRLLSLGVTESTLAVLRRSARLSELSRRVINAADKVAEQNQQGAAGLEHLLLVLGRERRSMASRWLHDSGMMQEQLTQDIQQIHLDPLLAATALDEVMAKAVDLGETLGTHYTGTDHILLAMTWDDEAIALMRHYGVDVERLRELIQNTFRR